MKSTARVCTVLPEVSPPSLPAPTSILSTPQQFSSTVMCIISTSHSHAHVPLVVAVRLQMKLVSRTAQTRSVLAFGLWNLSQFDAVRLQLCSNAICSAPARVLSDV
ncbi:hypothetical protein ACLKA6_000309 [Drosophila palustris]